MIIDNLYPVDGKRSSRPSTVITTFKVPDERLYKTMSRYRRGQYDDVLTAGYRSYERIAAKAHTKKSNS